MSKTEENSSPPSPEALRGGVEAYFDQCEAEGVFPDWPGLKLFLGVFDDRIY